MPMRTGLNAPATRPNAANRPPMVPTPAAPGEQPPPVVATGPMAQPVPQLSDEAQLWRDVQVWGEALGQQIWLTAQRHGAKIRAQLAAVAETYLSEAGIPTGQPTPPRAVNADTGASIAVRPRADGPVAAPRLPRLRFAALQPLRLPALALVDRECCITLEAAQDLPQVVAVQTGEVLHLYDFAALRAYWRVAPGANPMRGRRLTEADLYRVVVDDTNV